MSTEYIKGHNDGLILGLSMNAHITADGGGGCELFKIINKPVLGSGCIGAPVVLSNVGYAECAPILSVIRFIDYAKDISTEMRAPAGVPNAYSSLFLLLIEFFKSLGFTLDSYDVPSGSLYRSRFAMPECTCILELSRTASYSDVRIKTFIRNGSYISPSYITDKPVYMSSRTINNTIEVYISGTPLGVINSNVIYVPDWGISYGRVDGAWFGGSADTNTQVAFLNYSTAADSTYTITQNKTVYILDSSIYNGYKVITPNGEYTNMFNLGIKS